MVKKRPHTLTFNWNALSYSSGKVQSGAAGSLTISCRYVPVKRFLTRSDSSDVVLVNYKVYTNLLTSVIPNNASVTVEGRKYDVIQVFNYQTYSCIWL
jgi:hypothetical protein